MTTPTLEQGMFSDVVIGDDGVVTKTLRRPFETQEAAEEFCVRLIDYATALADGPLETAAFLGAETVDTSTGVTVRHYMELVPGKSVRVLGPHARRAAAATILAELAEAPAGPYALSLADPVDAKVSNFHTTNTGRPVLVDVCPPMSWDADGEVVCHGLSKGLVALAATTRFGTKPGAMARILSGTIAFDETTSRSSQLLKMADMGDEWYAELVPEGLSDTLRQALHGAVGRSLLTRAIYYRQHTESPTAGAS